jgi:hypothetical protein
VDIGNMVTAKDMAMVKDTDMRNMSTEEDKEDKINNRDEIRKNGLRNAAHFILKINNDQ